MGDHPASRGVIPFEPRASSLRPDRWTVEWFTTIDSTNRWLLEQARAGAPEGLVAVADHQTAGRGRRGRTWSAAPGSSLLASVLLRPQLAPDRLHVVTTRVALALIDALWATARLRAELKWPNDLVVGDRKLAGLLAEAEISGTSVRAVVIGMGCNLTQTEFPAELATSATSVALVTGRVPERDVLVDALLEHLDVRLDASAAAIRSDYRARLATLDRQVRVELDDGVIIGRARDVDGDGRLLVEHADGMTALSAGDVVHLR